MFATPEERHMSPVPILMHICCAPDATVPVLRLRAKGYEPVGFFYDPNIHPKEEYELRLDQARKLAVIENFELIVGPYELEHWLAAAREFWDEPEGGLRCPRCFGVLLDAAAHKAADLQIGVFTTTLLISPHKDVHVLEQVGHEKGALYGVRFLPEAFRKQDGFRESVHLSKEYGLYRQNYCGCIYSRIESEQWRAAHPNGSSWSREEPKDDSGRDMSHG
jgi:predicted adenine nucleotide alpha hydrolase (AANH) superfamily ATPase